MQGTKGQGLPLNTIIVAIIVIVVLVVIILITTGQLNQFQQTLRGGGTTAEACLGTEGNFCSPTGQCGSTASPDDSLNCVGGGTCCTPN